CETEKRAVRYCPLVRLPRTGPILRRSDEEGTMVHSHRHSIGTERPRRDWGDPLSVILAVQHDRRVPDHPKDGSGLASRLTTGGRPGPILTAVLSRSDSGRVG